MKRIVYIILLILWMSLIFMFSSESSQNSQNRSDKVTSEIVNIFTNTEGEEKDKLVEDFGFIIRKIAHFSLYLVLGILIYLVLNSYQVKHIILLSILFCFLYACSDEIHQSIRGDRSGKIYDVIIDTIGSSVGISSVYLINKKRKKR